ncbi:MAG: lactate utilization protein [Acidimicrobiia bacterium]|nr:lactate utilization protein [Acidimicrobiia bacterium]
MERDTFLQNVRAAMRTSQLPPIPEDPPGGYVPRLSEEGLVERFVERVLAVDGNAHRAADDAEAIRVVSGLLEKYEAAGYMAWDADQLPVAGLADHLPGISIRGAVTSNPSDRIDHQTGYMDLRVGITGATGGLAESGSIVLDCGPGRPRMASLIPLAHVALLRSTDIVPSLSHWVAAHPTAAIDTSNLVVITGPSRTADIEQVLNLGVHGPKHLHVVVVASS